MGGGDEGEVAGGSAFAKCEGRVMCVGGRGSGEGEVSGGHTYYPYLTRCPPPLQFEGQQVVGGEEDGERRAKRRRQTDEGAEAEAEGGRGRGEAHC